MTQGSHEIFTDRSAVVMPSNRKFGLTIGAILIAIAAGRWWLDWSPEWNLILLFAGAALIGLGIVAPAILAPLNHGWMKLGLILASVVNPVVMLAMFLIAFLPFALFMRAAQRDALQLKRRQAGESYWNVRSGEVTQPGSLTDQF